MGSLIEELRRREAAARAEADRLASFVSPTSHEQNHRSYAHDLLRSFPAAVVLEIPWERAGEAETAVLAGWLRHAVNPQRQRRRPRCAHGGCGQRGDRQAGARAGLCAVGEHAHADGRVRLLRLPPALRAVSGGQPGAGEQFRRKALAHRSPLLKAPPYRRATPTPGIAQG
jgi:hypothetical protein